ncbi:MAG: ABC transporter ATP-binding protein [Caldisphaeraceae archaeon]|nr:ABC transporter ATP-binding protein [Caldisphaeraceae archaeon]
MKKGIMKIRNLIAGYYTKSGIVFAVRGVSLDIYKNEILAIVGESGCGKSTLLSSIYRILKPPGKIFNGQVIFNGVDLLKIDEEKLRQMRMKEFSLVPQYAMDALNPVMKIGDYMKSALKDHEISASEAERLIDEKLDLVRLPRDIKNMYPHELSGGMRQRIVIATSLLLNPTLVFLDEPTTGLDVVVQYEILKDVKEIAKKLELSIVVISHDLPLMMMFAERIGIMYAGELVEIGDRDSVLYRPRHPYTMLLIKSVPSLINVRERLYMIPGTPPTLLNNVPNRCSFYDRCPFRFNRCFTERPILKEKDGRFSRCFLTHEEDVDLNLKPIPKEYYAEELARDKSLVTFNISGEKEKVIEVKDLVKIFTIRTGLITRRPLYAVNGVSFDLKMGSITSLVGGSGHGKSTIARILAGIEKQTSGYIYINGVDVSKLHKRREQWYKSKVQMVFQDPYSSLDPRHNVKWHIERPLLIHKKAKNEKELNEKIRQVMYLVDLKPPEKYLYKYPHELSGGERQRVAIGRAIAVEPLVLLADEPVSMLDASVRAGILNLLGRLKKIGMSILYITHDVATVSYISDYIMVIYRGKIVERGKTMDVIKNPRHEYTKKLISVVPDPYKKI